MGHSGQFGLCPVPKGSHEMRSWERRGGRGQTTAEQGLCQFGDAGSSSADSLCACSGIPPSAPGPFGMRMVVCK